MKVPRRRMASSFLTSNKFDSSPNQPSAPTGQSNNCRPLSFFHWRNITEGFLRFQIIWQQLNRWILALKFIKPYRPSSTFLTFFSFFISFQRPKNPPKLIKINIWRRKSQKLRGLRKSTNGDSNLCIAHNKCIIIDQ